MAETRWAGRPPRYDRETKGYVVYRSRTSGDGYEVVTPEPVQGMSWRDQTIEQGRPYYYVVTSIEHSELESGYSSEAPRVGIGLPTAANDRLTLYAEAEEALKDLGTDARPGLAIQIANRSGLLPRLQWIDAQPAEMLRSDRCPELIEKLAAME